MQVTTRVGNTLLVLGAAIMLSACASNPPPTDPTARVWRMAVADAKTPTIRIWDLEEREEVAVLTTHSPARLRAGLDEMEVAAIQGKSGQVQMLHMGLKRQDHGDHQHWVTGKPVLSAPILSGLKPSHANPGNGRLAVFYDGEGLARIYNPAAPGETDVIRTNASHHGLAVPLPRMRYLVSVAAEEGSLPRATQLMDAKGNVLQSNPPCTLQHGDATHGAWHLFGCANGLLVWHDAAQLGSGAFILVPYPKTSGARMVRTLLQSPVSGSFVGNFGADGLLFITLQPQDELPRLAPITLPAKLLHFAWDSQHPQTAYALLESGVLMTIDSSTQQVLGQTQAIPVWTDDASDTANRPPKPQLAVAEGRIVVSDARTGLVHVLRTKDLKQTDTLRVGGQPFSLALRSVDLSSEQ